MTDGTKETKNEDPKKDRFHDDFKGLPLEEKIKILLRMEAVTLQETFNYGLSEAIKAGERLGEVLSDFGKKVEAEIKKATSQCANEPVGAKPGSSKKPPKAEAPV
jgi:hypothetical protein